MPAASREPDSGPSLRRQLGRWDLTAIGINQVIGSAIYLVPAQVAGEIGAWGPIAFLLAGFTTLLIALCFAEVGSRFEQTGGAYLYTEAAFGRFAAFEVGWMQWFTRVCSQAAVANGIALALGYYWPGIRSGISRSGMITLLIFALAVLNVRGVRQTSWFVNALTICKLVPLAALIAAGVFVIKWDRLSPLPEVSLHQAVTAGLLLCFTYGGFDVISVPAGEATNPRRHLPFAFMMTIAVVSVVMTTLQTIAASTVDNLAASTTPLADAALLLLGPLGAAMIGLGSVVSMLGNSTGQVLAGSRMLFALSENRALPRFLAFIHPEHRTPSHAIWFTSAIALATALTGTFGFLAAVSAVSRLITYAGVCAATLALRSRRFDTAVRPAQFVVPGGWVVPVLATVISLAFVIGASREQLLAGLGGLAAGALLFALTNRRRSRPSGVGHDF